jgi:hypothetical protein
LQADAFAGFHQLYEGGRVLEAACWSHARRKMWDNQHRMPDCLRAIHRFDSANSVSRWAVFFCRPRKRTFTSAELALDHSKRVLHLRSNAGLAVLLLACSDFP